MKWIVTQQSFHKPTPSPRGVSVTRGVLQVRDTSAVKGGGLAAVGNLTLGAEHRGVNMLGLSAGVGPEGPGEL